ncbi:putative membrane protein [Humitalea rosea]|uniref:Putative membrane protein n=1 Tax=Humitalea rosea TaxID=990373 RepID=A0A2W7IFH3_9PROT|nr:DUF2244 domain-containing protein [Humitalea rosea]PZW45658.1 putative membrane protein [Humitalea rosea]
MTEPEAPLFEAISTPNASVTRGTLLGVAGVLAAGAAATSVLFLWIGAWPVFGFLGIEMAVVLGLLLTHARRSSRSYERLLLAEGRLTIERRDGRGRKESLALDPYWTRMEWQDAPGTPLLLSCRGQRVEIGRHLNAAERRSLHGALAAALRAWKTPVFNNPQL